MLDVVAAIALAAAGVGLITWGADTFADNVSQAAARLGTTTFALTVLLAGAEPEELATAVTAAARDAPAIALGDAIGANVAICLVALGVGALRAPLPFGRRVLRYGIFALTPTGLAVATLWDGHIGRLGGAVLVMAYMGYVAAVWILEREPPSLGEAAGERDDRLAGASQENRVGRELALVVAGLAAMAIGATLLVDSVRDLVETETQQARVALTIVGFATGFELVVLAWASARRDTTEVLVAAVVGSVAYNATMTVGAAALVQPLRISDASLLHAPMVAMAVALVAPLAVAARHRRLGPHHGAALLAAYPAFVALVVLG